ncbi:MAG TPA: VIT domain-containing protein [Gemmatimonadales bacterium]|nr:VIT domain-containing protein [Gemmatimonadales bacterium]
MNRNLSLSLVATLVGTLASPTLVVGQGWIERPIIREGPVGPASVDVQKLRSAVSVTVSGRVAHVTVEEWFQNRGGWLQEASYLYPLLGEASFSDFSLWQGDQELKGETMDAARARSIYEEIVRRKRDPALIELAGYGLLRARVFPIAPGETRKITLRYTQVLERAGDALRFRFPAASGPGTAPRSFRVSADNGAGFGDPYSPTHRVTTRRDGSRLEVELADSTCGTVDLLLPLARASVGLSLLTQHPAGEDGYFMLLLAPGSQPAATRQTRDITAVLDISGSMSGEKLTQAKAALQQLLGTLQEGDRFRLVAFSGGVRRFAEDWTPLTRDARRRAESWVSDLQAEGGTNIAGALAEAFRMPPAEAALGIVVFLTDGLPTVGESNPERIVDRAEQSRGRSRVFAFGIGDDVNTYLLDRLTERGRGSTEYIRQDYEVERSVGALAARIAEPVLTDLAIAGVGVELYDVQPGTLPDVFAGDEVIVLGRYRFSGGPAEDRTVSARGDRGGRTEQFRTALVDREAPDAGYIEQLWAARKAGALAREIRLHGERPELVQELRDLALRYGILTEYTAYLVQEPTAVAAQSRAVPRDEVSAKAVNQAQAEGDLARRTVAAAPTASYLEARIDAASAGSSARRLGGRLFELRDSVWSDVRRDAGQPVIKVAAFSDAYFALLRALPELLGPARLSPAVRVAGSRVTIEIGSPGKADWAPGELEQVVRDFR